MFQLSVEAVWSARIEFVELRTEDWKMASWRKEEEADVSKALLAASPEWVVDWDISPAARGLGSACWPISPSFEGGLMAGERTKGSTGGIGEIFGVELGDGKRVASPLRVRIAVIVKLGVGALTRSQGILSPGEVEKTELERKKSKIEIT